MENRNLFRLIIVGRDRIAEILARLHIHPNLLTVLGALSNLVAAFVIARGLFVLAGALVLMSNLFDFLDGAVARHVGLEDRFGAFFDSVMDRYSDLFLFAGLTAWFMTQGRYLLTAVTLAAILGAVLTSYIRARAESLIPSCKVGFLERPERIVLLVLACFVSRVEACVWILAILGNLTAVQRILYTWQHLSVGARARKAEGS